MIRAALATSFATVMAVTTLGLPRWATAAPPSAPVLEVSPSAIDAGSVELIGMTATSKLQIGNTGGGTLKLLDVQIVDGGTGAAADWTVTAGSTCSLSIPPECDIAAAQTVELSLVFDPSAIAVRDATLVIHYNDNADRSTSIPLHGIGSGATLDLLGGARTLDFGTLPVGAPASLTVTVVNRGSRDLTDATAVVTQTGTAFSAAHGAPAGAMLTVPAGAAGQTVTVTCEPPAAGTFSGMVQISATDVQGDPIALPVSCAAKTGTGAPTLTATPPAIQLGEVRAGAQAVQHVAIASVAATPSALASAAFDATPPGLSIGSVAPATPATLDLTAAPDPSIVDVTNLGAHLIVTPTGGQPLSVAITGEVVTAHYRVPGAISLGTFCTNQPATSRIVELIADGTGTIGVSAPTLAGAAGSAYDLQLVAPVAYPTTLPAMAHAVVSVTPRQRDTAGVATDDLVWSTDVDGAETTPTTLTSTFVDDGGAIAPESLTFTRTQIHLDTANAQEVTLQNCEVSPLQLDPPDVPVPFTIDSPSFPTMLQPGEIASFSVGFHPTKVGASTKTLVITSPQLAGVQLTVTMTGEGYAEGGTSVTPDAGADATAPAAQASFYACGSCAANDPAGALVFGIAVLVTVIPRRRRGR